MITGTIVGQEDAVEPSSSKLSDEKYVDAKSSSLVTSSKMKLPETPQPHVQSTARPNVQEGNSQLQKMHNLQQNVTSSEPTRQEAALQRLIPERKDFWFMEEHQQGRNKPTSDITFAVDDLTIPWSDLVLKERIGSGKCVYILSWILSSHWRGPIQSLARCDTGMEGDVELDLSSSTVNQRQSGFIIFFLAVYWCINKSFI